MTDFGIFPSDFFVTIPAAIYKFVFMCNYFMFQYNIFGDTKIIKAHNPFSGTEFSFISGNIHFVGIQAWIFRLEKYFNIDFSLTIFELLMSGALIVLLGYAFIKFIVPLF